jgi:hypothetical protein
MANIDSVMADITFLMANIESLMATIKRPMVNIKSRMAIIKPPMANIEALMATIQPRMADITSPYGNNYFGIPLENPRCYRSAVICCSMRRYPPRNPIREYDKPA